MKYLKIGVVVGGLLLIWCFFFLLATALTALVLQFAWNLGVVPVFGAKHIDYWPAFGLCLIIALIASAIKAVVRVKTK